SVAVVGVLAVVCVVAARMLGTHDQDVTVYSLTPEGKVQVIGLRHRTYLLDYGGDRDLVLFSTTRSTGVATYGQKEDIYPATGTRMTKTGNRRQRQTTRRKKGIERPSCRPGLCSGWPSAGVRQSRPCREVVGGTPGFSAPADVPRHLSL